MFYKGLFYVILILLFSSTFLFADVGTWTKVKKSRSNENDLVTENAETAFYDEFSFGGNVLVIPSEKAYYVRASLHKKNKWLKVSASHATQCDVVLFDGDDEIVSTYRIKTNEIYRNTFNDISSSQLMSVSRISTKCNYNPEAQYLCAGDEIRCKNDNDKLVVYLDAPFSPEAKEYGIEVKSAICVPKSKAACQTGWRTRYDENSMMYCEKK